MVTEVERTPSAEIRPAAAILVFGVLILATVVVRSFDPDSFNHDVAWILHVAGQMLGGSVLYIDIVEENPPLVFWLSVPAVAVARALGCSPILVFNLGVAAAIAWTAALVYRIVRGAQPGTPTIYAVSIAGVLVALEVLAPGYEYGQRDHLFAIAVFPYVFAAAARLQGQRIETRLALAAGLFAGLGIALKPYFLLFWLVVELFLFFAAPGYSRGAFCNPLDTPPNM